MFKKSLIGLFIVSSFGLLGEVYAADFKNAVGNETVSSDTLVEAIKTLPAISPTSVEPTSEDNDSVEAAAQAENIAAQHSDASDDAENQSDLGITKDRSFGLDAKIDMKKLINKSATFDVATNLNLGKEGKLEINAEDEETNILHKALNLMVKVMGTLAILLYVVGGFFLITSQGDENQTQKGKTILTYTTLGLAISFASYLLVYLVMSATFTLG